MVVYFQKREIVIPGQTLAEGRYRSSIGTYYENGKILSALVGLAELRGNTVKVVPLNGVYIPREGDIVVGTINVVAGNNWKVDIGGPYGASLHANNALRRPYDEDISRYFDIGDTIAAEIISFDRSSGPFLTMKGRGLSKLDEGMILEVSPVKVPRIIGRRGSMINMIKDHLRIESVVGQNGRIWIRASDTPTLCLAIKAFKMIEQEAHTSKLTDRISAMLKEELEKMRGTSVPLPENETDGSESLSEPESGSEPAVEPVSENETIEEFKEESTEKLEKENETDTTNKEVTEL